MLRLIHLQCSTHAHAHIGNTFPLLSVTVCLVCWGRDVIKLNQNVTLRQIKNECELNTMCKFRTEGEMFASERYLSNDLSILSVDLSDAAPLCQEGEDLVELQDKDRETVNTTAVVRSDVSHKATGSL